MADLSVQEDGGGDYVTLDEACDNITATDTITISESWTNPDTRAVIVSTDCFVTATGASRITTARHVAVTPTHYRLHVADGNHCITVNDAPTEIDGIEIKQNAAGSSDEGVRMAVAGVLTLKNDIIFGDGTSTQQDGVYTNNQVDTTINFENCIIYSWGRNCFYDQNSLGTTTHTINMNSCTLWDGAVAGLAIRISNTNLTISINVHNTISDSVGGAYREDGTDNATQTWGISYSTDNGTSITTVDGGGVGNLESRVLRTSTSGGDEILVTDLTVGAADLSLVNDATNNDAQDAHTTDSAEGLTIPATDIDGTSRPQNVSHDIGAHVVVAAAPSGIVPFRRRIEGY